ncbi:glycosyltransferase family 2 protein [Streptomyces malaysiensis]|uniref:glycosyltransferase family 2 protein n=2 Tax=Streptomyces malaysiensis TaxID=92644 RepID=UPI001E29AC5D|nr:glycosyltransferase family 2 protein [Streptomyces sp. M56]
MRISVVICVYTEERWDDILAAVDSVRTQSLPAQETLLVVDHNTRLLRRLKDHYGDGGAGAAVGGGARAGAAVGAAGAYTGAPRDTAGPARNAREADANPGAGAGTDAFTGPAQDTAFPARDAVGAGAGAGGRGGSAAAGAYVDAGAGQRVRVVANVGPRGLSSGRNTGIAVSCGEVIAFLDDDAVAERDWLRHFAAAYADPRVLAVGGRTVPVWASRRRPVWFPEEFDWVVGCSYRGLPPGRVRVRNVLGGNASFRREAFHAVGGFASGIGRDGDKRPLGCEETELCIRLARARPDALLLIDDRAVIHHKVPAARERFGYFRSRTYAEGLSKALVTRSVGAQAGLETERRYTTRVLPAGITRGLRDALLGRAGGAGRAGAIVVGVAAAAGGYLVGTARARRGGPRFTVAAVPDLSAPDPSAPSAHARADDGPARSRHESTHESRHESTSRREGG